jgi:hypothetical protein
VLNNELEETFRRWYPKFRPQPKNRETRQKGRLTPDLLTLSWLPKNLEWFVSAEPCIDALQLLPIQS